MDRQAYQIELVKKAQQGDKNSLDQLAMQSRDRLHTYVLRMTQQEDLAQEIVQESLLEMFKVIGKLREADRFWPWLYGIATNKLRRYYRTESTQRRVATASLQQKGSMHERQGGLEDLVGDELKQIVSGAMKKLKTRHKAVLIMRCYDEMPYSEIAETMGCSEFSTRMLFMRAKRALQKELSRNGFGKGSLLAALIVFGKMTAPSKAAAAEISIAATTVKVGVVAGTVGVATSKTAILSIAAAGMLTTGTVVMKPEILPWNSQNSHNPSGGIVNVIGDADKNSNLNEEYKWYFPQGPGSAVPVMMQAQFGTVGDSSYHQVLQNQLGNYFYSNSNNIVNINNHHMYDENLRVLQMPTDDPSMSDFISQVEGYKSNIMHVSVKDRGLLVIEPRKLSSGERPVPITHKNVLEEDYFQADWAATAEVIDNRDQMHYRGWTYFRVSGKINGQDVSGKGRIPFVYSQSIENTPWITMQIGSDRVLTDKSNEAYIYTNDGDTTELYKGGSFFTGLARPWMGLHAIDTVRRDAAQEGIIFETQYKEDSDKTVAQVKLINDNLTIVYDIDLINDVINNIDFINDKGYVGNLEFTYLQNIDGLDAEFSVRSKPRQKTTSMDSQGILWFTKLLE